MIRLLVLDVDGTMTDGGVYYDATGNELKKFAIKDGAGLVLAHAAGIEVMILTGRECEAVRRRAADLHVEHLYQNVSDKAAFLRAFLAQHSLRREETAYCGDDLNDLAAMALCGFCGLPGRRDARRGRARRLPLPAPRRRRRRARRRGGDPAAGRQAGRRRPPGVRGRNLNFEGTP